MFKYLFKKIFGTENDRFLKSIRPTIAKINSYEDSFKSLSDADLAAKPPISNRG